jgi:hypothetical protein
MGNMFAVNVEKFGVSRRGPPNPCCQKDKILSRAERSLLGNQRVPSVRTGDESGNVPVLMRNTLTTLRVSYGENLTG